MSLAAKSHAGGVAPQMTRSTPMQIQAMGRPARLPTTPGGPETWRAAWRCALLRAAWLGLAVPAPALLGALPAPAQAQGTTVAIGGALLDANAEVWRRLVELAGGPGSCYAVLPAASGEPERSAATVAANLARHGGRAELLRVSPRLADEPVADAVRDPRWIAVLERCRGVFMTGGAQSRLLDALQPGGRASPLLDAMRALWQRGGVVAGTSSGAAVLSEVVFRDAPDPLAVMKGRLREGREWAPGFGFLPPQVVVDQHFVRRGRIARLLPLMQAQRRTLGLGVEEDSAAVVHDGVVEVLGARGVLVAELAEATHDAKLGAFNLAGARLHWLESGDRYEIAAARVLPAARKQAGTRLEPLDPRHAGYHQGPAFYADVLGEDTIVRAMARLVDSDQRSVRGLAFAARPAEDDPAPDLGFEWRLSADGATRGWLLTGPESYTLAGVRLDIVPVRMTRPLYTPLVPAPPPVTPVPAASR